MRKVVCDYMRDIESEEIEIIILLVMEWMFAALVILLEREIAMV